MHVILSTVRMQCHTEKRKSTGSKYLWHNSRYFCSSSCTENIQHSFKYLWNYNLQDTQIHWKCPHVENSQIQLALASMARYHINFHYYRHTQHNSWYSYQTASPALQVVLDVGYFCSYACLDVAWCVCMSLCWSRRWAQLKQLNRSRCRLIKWGHIHMVNTIVIARKFLMKYNSIINFLQKIRSFSWKCQFDFDHVKEVCISQATEVGFTGEVEKFIIL